MPASPLLLTALLFLSPVAQGAVNVPLTIQSATYPGSVDPGSINWSQDPVTMGIPFADGAVASANQLGVSGASAYQFRVLGRWPSGSIKWALMDAIVDGPGTINLGAGSGKFGGSDLAADNGTTITVNTGAAQFVIKKQNFNGIDSAVVGGVTLMTSSSDPNRGLVVVGPDPNAAYPGNVTCGNCTTVYSSANDASSQTTVEENGPAKAVIRAIGSHKDAGGRAYLQYTARLYFYKGKSTVKVVVVLRNANYDTSSTPSPEATGGFNTAFKGVRAYELRLGAALSGPVSYTIATEGAPQTGTLSGSDSVWVYQGQSDWLPGNTVDGAYCAAGTPCANEYTTDSGWVIKKNGSTLASGGINSPVGGWADVRGGAGSGIQIGAYQMSAYWPISLEFNNGGTDVRIGLLSGRNAMAVHVPWPQWTTREVFLNFHNAALATPANDFLRFQHFLLARAPFSYYNTANVFPYPIVDPAAEDSFYVKAGQESDPPISMSKLCFGGGSTNCTPDRGVTDLGSYALFMNLGVPRAYPWGAGGSLNQLELRLSDLFKFLQRGHTGRFLNSKHFYQYQSDLYYPHADGNSRSDSAVNGFNWRTRSPSEYNSFGMPYYIRAAAANRAVGFGGAYGDPQWREASHDHWYGILNYYFLTGDETIKETIVTNKDYFLNHNTYQWGDGIPNSNGGNVTFSRAFGHLMAGAAQYTEYLRAIGDSDAEAVLAMGERNFDLYVDRPSCLNGFPRGCTAPSPNQWNAGTPDPIGTSMERGVHTLGSRIGGWCDYNDGSQSGMTGSHRAGSSLQQSLLEQGILLLRRAEGPGWPKYQRALDLAFGMSQFVFMEMFSDNGSAKWRDAPVDAAGYFSRYNGMHHTAILDYPNVCPANTVQSGLIVGPFDGKLYQDQALPLYVQNVYFNFYLQALVNGISDDLVRRFKIVMQRSSYATSVWPGEFGMFSIGSVIHEITQPNATKLINVPITSFQDNGNGTYALGWTPPAGAQSYTIRWGEKRVVDSLNFDSMYTNTFAYSPDTHQNWWTAHPVTDSLAGSSAGTAITTGAAGYSAANFSVKARVPSTTTQPPIAPCDVNRDNTTNMLDVDLCVSQAIGQYACGTGDINKDGKCDVVDVQRVVNALLGGQCVAN